MNAIVTTEMRFVRDRQTGWVYTTTALPYSFWSRYLGAFERVRVIARVELREGKPAKALRADGSGVEFVDLPCYQGPLEYLWCRRRVRAVLDAAMAGPEVAILRVPSQVGTMAVKAMARTRKPFGLEIVGDPAASFARGASRHPLRPLFQAMFTRRLRQQCRWARATAYVTASALQHRFPPEAGAFTTSYSSVELPRQAFREKPRDAPEPGRRLRIIAVASLEQPYKGIDLLLRAVAASDLAVEIVGEGRLRPDLEKLARRLGIASRVVFAGAVPRGKAVRDRLDAADLFVLPSRSEGLPRALIEAMARALPCIGTRVGGVPELLEDHALAPPSAKALARRIREFAGDPARMAAASARNLVKAHEYEEGALRSRREAFYATLGGGLCVSST